ncbi:MAG: dihydroorotate dehydrogenase electron transfer subunit [Lachnospiraceae bacterium]|nr:dihydroorotate dehydrogenase electron transfer subunit [Lachnospiraceae bacterium]
MTQKRKTNVTITKTKQLATGVYEMILQTPQAKEAGAGQFVALYTKDRSRLLPRPISICGIDPEQETLRLVYRVAGAGTGEFSTYREGDTVAMLGILGNGYPLDQARGKQALILGGGIGIPPILGLAQALKGENVTAILGYRDRELFLKDDFDQVCQTYVATEDGSVGTKGNVLDAVRMLEEKGELNPDIIFSCGPLPMLKAIKKYAEERGIPAYLSLEERMACGVGACLGCVCKTTHKDEHSQVNNARVCTEGPVFLASDVMI